jgi:signal transduction histidine kinase
MAGSGATEPGAPTPPTQDPPAAPDPDVALRRLVRRMPVGVVVLGPDRSIAYRNEEAARILGTGPAGDDVGAGPFPRFRTWDGEPFGPGAEPVEVAIRSGRPIVRRPVAQVRPDGGVVRMVLSLDPVLDARDAVAGLTLILEDQGDELAGHALGEAIVAMLSHELRTPVTAIYGGSQLLLDRRLPGDLHDSVVGDIAQEAERLHRLVEDLLAIARSERGLGARGLEPVLVHRSAAATADLERRRRPWADIEVHAESDLPPVRATEDEVRQVLRNLLSNALASGGPDRVTIDIRLVGDEVITAVSDRGRGLAAAAGRDAFSLYHRSPAVARHVPGTGVELYVARTIVEALDGRIWVDERPGGGSTIHVAFRRYDEPGDPSVGIAPLGPAVRREDGPAASVTTSTSTVGRR